MGDNWEFVFQNGSSVSEIAEFFKSNGSVHLQTNDENMVGTQRTVIRACDSLSRLIELNLYLNISDNTAPEFVDDLQTEFELYINDTINYKLPDITEDEIDEAEVYINSMENQDFPGFLSFNNATYTISMKPENDTQYQGYTYYFSVVLKRQHSDYIMNIYYITVRFLGDPWVEPEPEPEDNGEEEEEEEEIIKEKVTFNITEITWKSKGQIRFSEAVNITHIVDNFDSIFSVYIDSKTRNKTEEVKGFEITSFADNMTINFTAEFLWPYLYGLLNKKKDYLMLEIRNGTNESDFVYNATYHELGNNYTRLSIPMQFDYRNEKMTYMRNTANLLYYIMIGLVVL